MRKLFYVAIVTTVLNGCTLNDFFGYEENTGLYVIDAPSGYGNKRFGAELAASSTLEGDFLTVSAGIGHKPVLYKLSADGRLRDVKDNEDWNVSSAPDTTAALVGLPFFGDSLLGCFAVGEPDDNRVSLLCDNSTDNLRIVGGEDSGFGSHLAGVRPAGNDPWLLAVAEEDSVQLFSSAENPGGNSSDLLAPMDDAANPRAPIEALAAGRRLNQVLVAVAAPVDTDGPLGVHLFVQAAAYSTEFVQVACLSRSSEPGFGAVLTFGDLNDDGVDELLVSASTEPDRESAVYIYDADALIPNPIDPNAAVSPCHSPSPLSVLVPQDEDTNIECEAECEFGVSLAVGDIATDDDGPEIAVGAPGAKVGGKGAAGAVYLYRGQDAYSGDVEVVGRVTDSYPEGGHRWGGGLTIAPMAGRNELVVGATGNGQAIIAFCTGVGDNLLDGADIPDDGDGKFVSSRCRP